MTCIVALKDSKGVYIGGDSAGLNGWDINTRTDEKVFKKNGFLFGFTGSFRITQLLRYSFDPPEQASKKSDMEYMTTDFINGVRKCLKNGGYAEIKDNVEEGGTFIVCYKGQMFNVYNDYQVGQISDSFMSCGCGSDYAKATLYNNQNLKISPKKKLIQALETAEHFSAGVRRPFIILKMDNDD